MSRFIQFHILTSYPPANLNRDDLGRPKTAKMGGVDRLRVSSQSLKRAWRKSDLFEDALGEHLGTRTKRLGIQVFEKFTQKGIDEKKALDWSRKIAGTFGALKKENKKKPLEGLQIEQLVHIGPVEQDLLDRLVQKLSDEKRAPEDADLNLLRKQNQAVDIALFGRMLASSTQNNMEASCQVAHSISVHGITIEDDYFTAVDDLNDSSDDAGAAHLGETGFASALFYSYVCLNRELLKENLGGDEVLVKKAIKALTEAMLKVSPEGKQNSFASRAYASYVLAEKGDQQPRSLSVAFLKPIDGTDYGHSTPAALEKQFKNMDAVYGACADQRYTINAPEGIGKLEELLNFVTE